MDEDSLYIAYVTGENPNKDVKFTRINQPRKKPLTAPEIAARAIQIIGDDRPFIILLAEHEEELEDKLREAGFDDKFQFIRNYSKAEAV